MIWPLAALHFRNLTWLFTSFHGVADVAPLQLGDEVAARNVGPASEVAGPPENARYLPAFQVRAWLDFCTAGRAFAGCAACRWTAGMHQLRGWACGTAMALPSRLPPQIPCC